MTAISIQSPAIPENAPGTLRAPWLRAVRAARLVRLCFVEARPVVQFIYGMRFLAGIALSGARDPGSYRLLLALGTWLLATSSVYLFDGVMDIVEDQLNGSPRPIASGRLPRPVALAVSIAWAALSLIGAVALGRPYVFLTALLLLLGYAYCAPPFRLKQWSAGAGGTVLIAGLLTFAAGGALNGQLRPTNALIIFALAMSCWMGFVGALAKDFSDIYGDTVAGRRTLAVMRGVRRAAWRLSLHAVLVSIAFTTAAGLAGRILLLSAVAVFAGALAVAVTCFRHSPDGPQRRPYRAFMVTQYAAHLTVFLAAIAA